MEIARLLSLALRPKRFILTHLRIMDLELLDDEDPWEFIDFNVWINQGVPPLSYERLQIRLYSKALMRTRKTLALMLIPVALFLAIKSIVEDSPAMFVTPGFILFQVLVGSMRHLREDIDGHIKNRRVPTYCFPPEEEQ